MNCKLEHIIMERSLNQQWSVDENLDYDQFLGDGGADEFSNYLCENCDLPLDDSLAVKQHLEGSQS